VQVVPVEKYIVAAAAAMGREVFKSELSVPPALGAEFLERVPRSTSRTVLAKITPIKESEQLAKVN
jgi:hypothetical protein